MRETPLLQMTASYSTTVSTASLFLERTGYSKVMNNNKGSLYV